MVGLVVPHLMDNHCILGVHAMKGDFAMLPRRGQQKSGLSAALFGCGCPGEARPGMTTIANSSRTPRRRPTRIALHTRAVSHESKVAALAAHLAFVALGFCLGAALGL